MSRDAAFAWQVILRTMNNAAGTRAKREEEIAFLAMEDVLGIDIRLADVGARNKMPDGAWVYPYGQGRKGLVEITSPPADVLMKEWAAAKRERRPQTESGSIPTRLGELAQVCHEMLATDWARENIDKLVAQPADERHLFLFGRTHDVNHYFYRLSDTLDDAPAEHVEDLQLSEGISDVWFRSRTGPAPEDRHGGGRSGSLDFRLVPAGTAMWRTSRSITFRPLTPASSMTWFPTVGESRRTGRSRQPTAKPRLSCCQGPAGGDDLISGA